MSEQLAFVVFVVVVGGALALVTVGMLVAVALLVRWNRSSDRR